jgi:hypothetical protein
MCENCEQKEVEISKASEEQLDDIHADLTMGLASVGREIVNLQKQLFNLTAQIEQIELEQESREAKKQGRMN